MPTHRSFGQSHTTSGLSHPSADTSPPAQAPSRFFSIFPDRISATTTRSDGNSRGIFRFLFGIQSVRDPVSGRETNEQEKPSSTSYLNEESNVSSDDLDSDLDITENPLNQEAPSTASQAGQSSIDRSHGSHYASPPARPSRSSLASPLLESSVSTRLLSSLNWVSGTGGNQENSSRDSSFSSSSKGGIPSTRVSEEQQQLQRDSSLSMSQIRGTTSSRDELTDV